MWQPGVSVESIRSEHTETAGGFKATWGCVLLTKWTNFQLKQRVGLLGLIYSSWTKQLLKMEWKRNEYDLCKEWLWLTVTVKTPAKAWYCFPVHQNKSIIFTQATSEVGKHWEGKTEVTIIKTFLLRGQSQLQGRESLVLLHKVRFIKSAALK